MTIQDGLDFSKRGKALIGQEMFIILDRAKKIEQAGKHVFHLELGEPRIEPPEEIIMETIKAINEGKIGYCSSAGLLELREKIAEFYSISGRKLSISNVAISPANLLISQFLDIVCNRGDRVALFTPAFPTYLAACKHAGLEMSFVPLSPENGFQLREDHIDIAISHRPKTIIINSGNNPTGAIYDESVLIYLLKRCEENGCWLLSDETYSKLNYIKDYYSFINYEYNKLMVISSFSKIFGIPGFRIGFAIADPMVIDKVTLSTSTLYSCLPIFTQVGAVRAVNLIDSFAIRIKKHYSILINECMDIINNSHATACTVPDAAFYLFIDISKTKMDDLIFANRLLEESHTAVTPGISFGYGGKGFVRASICGEPENVKGGIRRLIEFADAAMNHTRKG